MSALISFLIVNYKTERLTLGLIKSIKDHIKKYEFEILIYDNSYTEFNQLNKIKNYNIKIYGDGKNIGFVKANNFLFRKSKGSILVLINNDVLLIDSSLEILFDYIMTQNDIGAIGPMLLNVNETYQISFYKFPNLFSTICEFIFLSKKNPYRYKTDINKIQECDVIKGACLVLKRNTIKNEFIFDDKFTMFSEEVDLCYRLVKSGYKNIYFPLSKIIHFGGESSNLNKETKKYSNYHYFKSKKIFFKKHYKPYIFKIYNSILILSLIERIILFVILLKKENVKIFVSILKKIISKDYEKN